MGVFSWLIIIIPLVFIFYMAFYVKRYIRGAADYLVGGRVAGRYVIAIGDLESALGVITIVMMLEQNFRCGFSVGFWWGLGTPLSLFMALTGYCIYRYRQTKAISMGQFIEMRYNRPLRIFTAFLRTISEMTANCIGPAVVARFFLYFFNIPVYIDICGFKVSSFMLLIGSALLLCILIIWHGGAAGSEGFADRETGYAVRFTKNRISPDSPDIAVRNRISEALGIPKRVW